VSVGGSILGNDVKRVEDPRFITGQGRFLDDLQVDGVLHLKSVRSVVPHGTLNGVDRSAAETMPGVVAVLTAEDIDVPPIHTPRGLDPATSRPRLATGRVRFVGEVIAVVVAETAQQAADAADMVWPDIDPLPGVAHMDAALAPDAPVLYPSVGSNIVDTGGDDHDADLFAGADRVVGHRFYNQRVAAVPLEGSGILVEPHDDGTYTVHAGTQLVWSQRNNLSRALGIDRDAVRAIQPDTGGGFGAKFYSYPEHVLAALAARLTGRPVKWVETRTENLLAMTQGRAMYQDVELGVRDDGTFTALRVKIDAHVGAYPSFGNALPGWVRWMAGGTYKIPRIEVSWRNVVTNTMAIHAYRGAGRPEATALLERIVDMAAAELDMDPAEIRRRNYIQPEDFPYDTPTGVTYDTGDYAAALERALDTAGYGDLRDEQRRRREAGGRHQLGVGISSYVEITAPEGPMEFAGVEVQPDGAIVARVGVASLGQGHETSFAQIVGGLLNVPYTDVEVVLQDTARLPRGAGNGGSRSLQLGGSAVFEASEVLIHKAKSIVAYINEAGVDDIVVFANGTVGVAGVPDTGMSWAEIATIADDPDELPFDMAPGLAAETTFDQGAATFPFGSHVSVVEVDTVTGDVEVLRHVAVDDAGNILNPRLLDGQVHGGIAQGLGQALYEEVRHDEDANPLTGTLVSYLIPLAANMPSFEVSHTVTPTPHNPLGVKGIGEAATIGSTPAIQNAVIDAVRHLGVDHIDMPLTPHRVWQALQGNGAAISS
jgi:carbon-monoxide dehydrogenase large subunit